MVEIDFAQLSYSNQREHLAKYMADPEKRMCANTWFREDTVDAWRHRRMYEMLDPLLTGDPGSSWLTVGDGRWGKDARYIHKKGGKVCATDITPNLLEHAKAIGFIPEYSVENAEKLSFANGSYDYVLCKEAFHHFPRPMIALYEMLRVATKGIVLIEPNDNGADGFEECGNYVYSLSRREIVKVALALSYPCVAIKGFNDCFIRGVEHEKLSAQSYLLKKTIHRIEAMDKACREGTCDYFMLATVFFIEKPNQEVIDKLNKDGFALMELKANPLLDKLAISADTTSSS
ncbi:methylase involved in ubiquinone/menaquinone biosynthesis [Desulfocurvibacter africanus PCS]|uniref:Methylase involved in ubiquinone/menaquinone biosynthesis n=1 Tax=Desulfocurvibacter africanus PCS TaxID=1262666 RepID=M5Q2G6_DESAF|nr:class I SAM-dependent methyltransferase [Desulfocurvibacter africanus]EMG38436.1 methylase involved in ubiquinone/menaquinone biosynthesis [Desulfocurvibacter africanus PCS]